MKTEDNMQNMSNGFPIYKQIIQTIRTDIERGVYPVGSKLPSEDDLAFNLGASRGTVRQALGELSSQGIVKRLHGKGTFVCEIGNEYKIENDHFISFLDGLESIGGPISTRIIDRKVVDATSVTTDVFPGLSKLFQIRRIRSRNDKVIMLSSDYIPVDLAHGIDLLYDGDKSVYNFLETRFNLRVCKVKRIFHAVSAAGETSKLLGVKNGDPLFYIVQQAFDELGRCVDHADLFIISEGMYFSIISSR